MDQSLRSAILEALAKTLSVELDHRRAAEDKLKVLEVTDSYGVHLSEISVDPHIHLPLRQLSSIVLRQYTNNHWSSLSDNFTSPEPSEDSKVTIRRLLVIGLKEPDTKVKNAIAYALANVAKWDWPDQWPDLLDILLMYIKTENPDLVDGSMRVLLELAGEITDKQIPTLGPIILQEVHKIFIDAQKYRLRTRELALDVFLTLYQVICEVALVNKSLVKPLLETMLLPFSQALVMALQASDGPALDNHLRAKIFQVLTSIVQNSPKQVSKLLEEMMPTVWATLVNLAEIFVKSILNATDAELNEGDITGSLDEGAGHPGKPLEAVFDFLNALVETPKMKNFVKAAIQDVLYYLLIYMQIPNSQVEDFLENIDSYIVNEDSDVYMKSVRIRAQDVLLNICKEFSEAPTALNNAVMRLLEQATAYKNEGRQDWWKCLEVCMHSLGLVAPMYVGLSKRGDQFISINPVIVVQSIFEDPRIRDAPPFLLGECIWAAGRLADILPEDLKSRILKASVEALHINQHHVMKVCGIRTIYDLCQHLENIKQTAEMLPYLPTLMDTLVGIANQYPEGEFLPLIIEVFPRLMVLDQAFTAASAPKFLPFLRDVFATKIKDMIIMDTVEEIIEKLVKIPEVLANIQTTLVPALVQLIHVHASKNEDVDAELAAIFRILKMIVRASASPLGQEMLHPLPLLLRVLAEKESEETIQEGGELLRAYIVTSPSQFCSFRDSEGRSGLHSALELASNMLSPQACERAAIYVGRLVNTLVQTTGDQLAERKEILLRLVLSKLNMSTDFSVKQSLVMVFAHLVHTQFESLMDFLATFPGPSGTSALEFVLNEWVSRQILFYGEFENKISCIALAKILQYGINSNDPRLVSIQVDGDEILSEETSVRTRAQKKHTPVVYTRIPMLVKIFKVLLCFMQSELDVAMASNVDELSDEESDNESEIGRDSSENFECEAVDLSNILKEEEEYNDLASVYSEFANDAEALQHPLYSVNLCAYLKEFVLQFVAQDFFDNSFKPNLNEAEKKTLSLLGVNV